MSNLFQAHTRSFALRSIAFSAAAALAACATTPPQTQQTAAPLAPNPILQAIATAAPNTPLSVATPQGTQTITVLSDYISGEGQECRAYSLAAPGTAPMQKLACNDGTAWRDIPPLALAANPGPQQ